MPSCYVLGIKSTSVVLAATKDENDIKTYVIKKANKM